MESAGAWANFRPLGLNVLVLLVSLSACAARAAEPNVEFDFARLAAYHVVAPCEAAEFTAGEKLVEVVLPISVRFHGVPVDSVQELNFEINGADTGLRVASFEPKTELHSDIVQTIYVSTTTEDARAIQATLGGEIPVPMGDVVSHVTPSVTAGLGKNETATERIQRLPPKQAIVVSGTSSQGRGVFFKLKRSSQTSLEGVHEVTVRFVVPDDWQGAAIRVACTARGERKVFWMDKPAMLGGTVAPVQLYEAGDAEMRELAKRRAEKAARPVRRQSLFEEAAAGLEQVAKTAWGDS
jgi:hypothetical protein